MRFLVPSQPYIQTPLIFLSWRRLPHMKRYAFAWGLCPACLKLFLSSSRQQGSLKWDTRISGTEGNRVGWEAWRSVRRISDSHIASANAARNASGRASRIKTTHTDGLNRYYRMEQWKTPCRVLSEMIMTKSETEKVYALSKLAGQCSDTGRNKKVVLKHFICADSLVVRRVVFASHEP